MAILNVPGDYPTIADAVAAASASDTIKVAAGYGGNENLNLAVDHLTFDIADGVPNIVLTSANNVSEIFCNGYGPVRSVRIGDAGNNSLEAGSPSLLQGAGGDDTLTASAGNCILDGGAGNDFIELRAANNLALGGQGDDILLDNTIVGDVLDGGSGFDVWQNESLYGGVVVNLLTGTAYLPSNGTSDILRNIEGVYMMDASTGRGSDDTLILSNVGGVGFGGIGDDIITGGTGDDRLNGSIDNDTLDGGAGTDTLDFTLGGYDYGGPPNGVTVDLAAGTATDEYGGTDTLTSIENVIGTSNPDSITGSSAANSLTGNEGADMLNGGDADDTLIGGQGNDILAGDAGNDTVDYTNDGGTLGVTVDLASGTATDSWGDTDTLAGIENVVGTIHSDSITGDGAANVLSGNDGNDTLSGGDRNDTLYGGRGADTLDGGANNDQVSYLEPTGVRGVTVNLATGEATDNWGGTDTLISVEQAIGSDRPDRLTGTSTPNVLTGGGGDDVLTGGAGADDLYGGTGTDTANYYEPTATGGVTVFYTVPEAGYAIESSGASDLLLSIENFIGTAYADQIQGSSVNNVLTGNEGGDRLDGKRWQGHGKLFRSHGHAAARRHRRPRRLPRDR